MKLVFIRHAEAVERDEWGGDDLSRPLTRHGRRDAKQLGRKLVDAAPDVIISSEAVRARETAELVAGKRRVEISALLNPGCSVAKARSVARKFSGTKTIALVGHEPDFSMIIAALIGDGTARIRMKKGAAAMVELDAKGRGELRWLMHPM